jgi:hypothetical protein
MNNCQLEYILQKYPVIVRVADQKRVKEGHFVILKTNTSYGSGKHLVVFFFS